MSATPKSNAPYPPGFWEQDGALHVSVPDALAYLGYKDTPENRDQMEKLIVDVFSKEGMKVQVVHQEELNN